MIVRHMKETAGHAATHRQHLGKVIAMLMENRRWSDRAVSKVCGTSISVVDAWKRGNAVPTPDQWSRLKRAVHGGFRDHTTLYQLARDEHEKEQDMITRGIESTTRTNGTPVHAAPTLSTSLGDKLREAITPLREAVQASPPPAEPEPAASTSTTPEDDEQRGKDGRKLPPPSPPGSRKADAIMRRAEFVRNLLRQRPHARRGGADGIDAALRKTFGIGLAPDMVERVRAEVHAEMAAAGNPVVEHARAQTPVVPVSERQSEPTHPMPAVTEQTEAAPAPSDGDITTAVQLILGAIPNLRAFTITVDDAGEASVDYEIRKVVVQTVGGSLKIRR